jgi:hypothetical protein
MPTYNPSALTRLRALRTRNEATLISIRSGILRGDYLDRKKLELPLREIMLAIKQIIESSRELTRDEKLELLTKHATIPMPVAEPSRRPKTIRKPKIESATTVMIAPLTQ